MVGVDRMDMVGPLVSAGPEEEIVAQGREVIYLHYFLCSRDCSTYHRCPCLTQPPMNSKKGPMPLRIRTLPSTQSNRTNPYHNKTGTLIWYPKTSTIMCTLAPTLMYNPCSGQFRLHLVTIKCMLRAIEPD